MVEYYRIAITEKKEITIALFITFKVISIHDDSNGFTNILINKSIGYDIPTIIEKLLSIGIKSIKLVWELDTNYYFSETVFTDYEYISNSNNLLTSVSCKELVDYRNDYYYNKERYK